MKKVFISDCEGPISKNDNAYEITTHYIPHGDRLFKVISSYDDVIAYLARREGYKAGDTLKLILPFLKAFGVTDEEMRNFSAKTLILMRDSRETLKRIRSIAPAFIVSTSYEHYIRALCEAVDFPYEDTYCTKVSLDKYNLNPEEKQRLVGLAYKIANMPIIEIPMNAVGLDDLPREYREIVKQLDEIFWNEIASMNIGRLLMEVNPIGGMEKAEVVKQVTLKLSTSPRNTIYVGDSITDVEAMKFVKANGGLAASFNGNRYAVRNADIAILAESNLVIAAIVELFLQYEKDLTLKIIDEWGSETLKRHGVDSHIVERLFSYTNLPKVTVVTNENIDVLIKESEAFRKQVRGESIGGLG